MKIAVLQADQPVCKAYALDPTSNTLVKTPYPMVNQFTSIQIPISTLDDLYATIEGAAASGAVLLKGELTRALNSESRAGATNPNEDTSWICLDLDGIENFQSVDIFLQSIGCGGTDYVLQWSSSQGLESYTGWRCHIFMLLDRPWHPQLLKNWLMNLNLEDKTINAQLRLTKTQNALLWPLDVTTCQNDKLIYVAPPRLGAGITDPLLGQPRIQKIVRGSPRLTITGEIPTREALRVKTDNKVNELRQSLGFPKRKATRYESAGSVEYMANPDSAVVTGRKVERGFVYLNLNGGDSWAYYHPENNPRFISNFKGEPAYRTEDLLPEYWAEVGGAVAPSTVATQTQNGLIYLAFRELKTSIYYNGFYDPATKTIELHTARNTGQLKDFLAQYDIELGEFVRDWTLVYEPNNPIIFDADKRIINRYIRSRYHMDTPYPVTVCPTPVKIVLEHVFNGDMAAIDHFINWFATIVQTKKMTRTAWLLQGVEGTGKGVLFHQIIRPILGEHNVVAKRFEEMGGGFNGFMRDKLMVFVDEVVPENTAQARAIATKLLNFIAEPEISIRDMYAMPYVHPNVSNFIFTSNARDSVHISTTDRRYNVGPYATTPFRPTDQFMLDLEASLQDFWCFLMGYNASPALAGRPLQSSARDTLIELGQTTLQLCIAAVKSGNYQWFVDQLPANDASAATMSFESTLALKAYKQVLQDIAADPEGHQTMSRDALFALFSWNVGKLPTAAAKFSSMLNHNDLQISPHSIGGRVQRGYRLSQPWVIPAPPKGV